jgi:outer membrane protein OmpA-like peptidoglycan-associated protein
MRFRAALIATALTYVTNSSAAPKIDEGLREKLSPLLREAQSRSGAVSMKSGIKLQLIADDGQAPEGLTFRVEPAPGTPPSADSGENGVAPGLYDLILNVGSTVVFQKNFLAMAGMISNLELHFGAAKGFELRQTLDFPQIRFMPGKVQLNRLSQPDIRRIAKFMAAEDKIRVLGVKVHTDSGGDERSNIELTTARAIQIRNALVKLGVDSQRIQAEGKGSAYPIAPNDSKDNRLKNRRTEFVVQETYPPSALVGGR